MSQLFRFPGALRRDPAIEAWMHEHSGALGAIAQRWFEVMRVSGGDVRELLHDGHPTACVGDAAFAYVNSFKTHVNVGFFRGAEIADPEGLLEGTGRFMRHVKLRPECDVDATALMKLIETAYADMKERLQAESRRAGPFSPPNGKKAHPIPVADASKRVISQRLSGKTDVRDRDA
jgi:hypothetical protein